MEFSGAYVTFTIAGTPRRVDLGTDRVVVGADASCTIVLHGPEVAPIHCELRRAPEGWRVVDLESRTGTRVNGDFVNTRALRSGDVVDVGGFFLVFEDASAAAAAVAAPEVGAEPVAPVVRTTVPRTALPRRAQRVAPRRAAAADHGGDRDDARAEAADERRSARERRSAASSTTTTMFVVGGVLAAGLVAWLALRVFFGETGNDHIRAQMVAAEQKLDWQRVVDLAAQAQADPSYDYEQILVIAERARRAIAGEAAGARIMQSIADWTSIRVWRQENWKADEEYVSRIDAFLTSYAGIESEGTKQARIERARVAGTSAVPGEVGEADHGWTVCLADAKVLEGDGRFGEAIAKVEAWWTANSQSAPTRIAGVESEKRRMIAAAEKWYAVQVALAHHYWGNGEMRKARNTLSRAADRIGLPGYAERAAEEAGKLGTK